MTNRVTALALLAACSACGGSGSQTNQVHGTIFSQPFAAKDAVSATGSWSNGFSFVGSSLAVEISDYATLCTYDTNSQQPPNTQQLDLVLAQVDTSGNATPPTSTGEFPILSSAAAGFWSQAWYEHGGSGPSGSLDCFKTGTSYSYSATSGKVVVTSISSGAVSGTFDLVLTSGDHITGSFNASACAGTNLNSSLYCP